MTEVYKTIPSLPAYEINAGGDIRRKDTLKIRSVYLNDAGYYALTILSKKCYVHILLMEAFIGPRPEGCTVDHIDRNRSNNRLDNLRYATRIEQRKNQVRSEVFLGGRQIQAVDSQGVIKTFLSVKAAISQYVSEKEKKTTVANNINKALKEGTEYKSLIWTYTSLKYEWTDIPEDIAGDVGYQVCKEGFVKMKNGRETKGFLSSQGYYVVGVSAGQKKVHNLIAETFMEKPSGENMMVNHKNAIKTDNRLENLEFVPQSENVKHAYRMGLITDPQCKKVNQLSLDGKLLKVFPNIKSAARSISDKRGTASSIGECCSGIRRKTVGGYKWTFA